MEKTNIAALIHLPGAWRFNLLGRSPIERTLIALSKVGVAEACLLTDEAGALQAHLAKNVQGIRLHFFGKNETEAARQHLAGWKPEAVFEFREPLAVDISVLQDLMNKPSGTANTGTLGGEVVLWQFADFQSNGKRSPVDPMVIGNRSCHPVRSEDELREVKARLIRNLTKPTDGWVSQHLNRPISTRISRVLAYTPITPNQFTLVTGLLAFLPVHFVLQGGYWNWLIGAAIYHLASVLDGVDGEIARLKMLSSKFGQWMDTLFDFASMFAVLTALVVSVNRTDQPLIVQKAGYVAVFAALASITSILIFVIRHKKGGTFSIQYSFLSGTSRWARLLQSATFLGKRDFYIFLFLLLAVAGLFPFALVYVAIMAVLVFIFSVQTHFSSGS